MCYHYGPVVPPTSSDIFNVEDRIRHFVNEPRRLHSLIKDAARWNMLCSSLDVISDTEQGIAAYEATPDSQVRAARYLFIYGIFQLLYVQQDAVETLALSLDLPFTLPAPLQRIRSIRNRTAGHPTRDTRAKAGKHMSHFLIQYSLSKNFCEYMTTHEDGDVVNQSVGALDLIQRQRTEVHRMLTAVADKLEVDEMQHRSKFKDERLADIFPPATDYLVGKIGEAASNESFGAIPMAQAAHGAVRKQVNDFKAALERREILTDSSHLTDQFEELDYPLDELGRWLQRGSVMDPRAARIFTFFIRHKIRALRQIAEEIDAEYDSAPYGSAPQVEGARIAVD